MSFILDALKKSENDRQRQSGPALFETRVAPRRTRFPMWAIALGALLLVNLGVVGWLTLRRPSASATPAAQATPATPSAPAAATPTAPQSAPPVASSQHAYPQGLQPPYQQAYPQGSQGNPPGQGYPQGQAYPPGQQPYPQGQTYPQQSQGYSPQQYPPQPGMNGVGAPNGGIAPQYNQAPPQTYGAQPNGIPQSGYPQSSPSLTDGTNPQGNIPQGNPDDYAPATEPPPPSPFSSYARRGTESGLPTYEEAAAKASLPPVHLDLHVYDPNPARRFVFVNSKRLMEGQSTPEGVKVDSITPDTAILSYRGTRFVMDRE